MNVFLRSIRWRLTSWYSISIALIFLGFACCVFLTYRYSCMAETRMRLNNELTLVASAVSNAPERLASIQEDFPASAFYVLADQRRSYVSALWGKLGLPSSIAFDADGYAFVASNGRPYAVRQSEVRVGGKTFRVGIAQDAQQTSEGLNKLLRALILSLPAILIVSLAGGYFLAGRFLSPIDDMARKAKQISADNLSERLSIGRQDDELSRLAGVFNDMLDRLEDSFDRLNRFASDASHELRTPLAVIRSLAENMLKTRRASALDRDVIGSILEETDRVTRLLDGLLTLTRAEAGQLPLSIEEIDLNEATLDVVNCLRVLAEEKAQTLTFEGETGLSVRLDESTFKQALINLVANAIQYTPEGGRIAVRVRRCAQRGALVEVDDNGPGIAIEHRAHIFERFYRIDKDRSQATGGSGLGLAIARWAIALNGGTVAFEAKQTPGSLFRIALPIATSKSAHARYAGLSSNPSRSASIAS
jgi:heavy metal sensor kinase